MHASESTLDSGTASHSSRHDMLAIISSRYQYGPFLFVVAEVMSSYLTTDGLKNFFLYFRGLPLRPEARGICHICHMVHPTLVESSLLGRLAAGLEASVDYIEMEGAGHCRHR